MINQFHILIIDDIVDNIQVAMSILKEDNYNLSFAQDGAEGLELIESNPHEFDLVLLDIMMPRMNGYEVCSKLKANPMTTDIPVIFLTAKADIDSLSKGFAKGAVDFITKPFHADELLARVKTHVTLYHAKQLLKANNIDLQAKVKVTQERLLSELEETQKEMIYVLTDLMEANSYETGKHVKRMAQVSALLAKLHPSLTDEDASILLDAAPMHDIGKITVPHEILHKPGKYTSSEFDEMKEHTTRAYNLLKGSRRRIMQAAAIIAHEHHEKWDGSGYPRGLKGADIHIYGRIVAIADVFDALTHKRCYKEAWSYDDALAYIQENKGTHFDPELVDIFVNNFEQFKAVCEFD